MFCTKCGNTIEDDYDFCPKCGAKVYRDQEQKDQYKEEYQDIAEEVYRDGYEDGYRVANQERYQYGEIWCNKWITLLLWLFLGVIGGHKFYERKIGMGILYIFTVGGFGVGLLIDLVVILGRPTYYRVK